MPSHWSPWYGTECGTLSAWTVIVCLLCGATATAESRQPVISRIFLHQGKTLVSYGDYVRIGDRVVFSLPVSDLMQGNTQLVTVPASVVDWSTTERYADAARAAHYASTRGEADFLRLSGGVAEVLNEIAFSDDLEQRRTLARDARHRLLEWTVAHYDYRDDDVHEIVALLDEAISWPNAGSADGSLSLGLVATTLRPARMSLLPPPTLQEIIVQAVTAAHLTPVPAERLSVLQTVVGLLNDSSSELPPEWRLGLLTAVSRELKSERHTSREYAALGRRVLVQAAVNAARADVRGVKLILEEMHAVDAGLGYGRPGFMSALVGAVDARLAAAQSLRLQRDRWLVRVDVFREYQREVARALTLFTRSGEMLDDVRLLAGPSPGRLGGLGEQLASAAAALARMDPPLEAQQVHELYRQAVLLAVEAVRGRYKAVQTGELAAAWTAASAAAGSLLLFERATEELDGVLTLPELN